MLLSDDQVKIKNKGLLYANSDLALACKISMAGGWNFHSETQQQLIESARDCLNTVLVALDDQRYGEDR